MTDDDHDRDSRVRAEAACELVNRTLADVPAALFDLGERLELQRCDEAAPEGFTDDDALDEVLRRAAAGDRGALLALYLDGRPAEDDRFFYPADWSPPKSVRDQSTGPGPGSDVIPPEEENV